MGKQTPKEEVAELIGRWVERSSDQKQHIAARAGFHAYHDFYHAYLDPGRNLNTDSHRTLGVIKAFTYGLPTEERATAAEAVRFCILTRLPLDGYKNIEEMEYFQAAEWQQAIRTYLSFREPTTNDLDRPDILATLARIERVLDASAASSLTGHEQNGAAAWEFALPTDEVPPLVSIHVPYRMPWGYSRLFTGRGATLLELARRVTEQVPPAAVAITGIGGVGKTSLAIEFVHRYGQFFPGGVFWLQASDGATLAVEIAACGDSGLITRADWGSLRTVERIQLVRQAWQQPIPRLLVLDNCEDEETLYSLQLTSGGCRVVVTSRKTHWSVASRATTLPIDTLNRSDSLALLRHYRADIPAENPDLHALAAALGDLPLALHLAGSYLATYQHDASLDDLPGFVRDLHATDLIDHDALQGVDVDATPTDHDPHIERTFLKSLELLDPLDVQDAQARLFLQRAAYFAPNAPVPRTLLTETLDFQHTTQTERQVARALRRLTELNLLTTVGNTLLIHPLIAAVARRIQDTTEARTSVEQLLANKTITSWDEDDTPTLHTLLPHLQFRVSAAGTRTDLVAVQLYRALPYALDVVGDTAGGIPYLERALAALEETDLLSTRLGADVLNDLAVWYRELGLLNEACAYQEQALTLRRQLLPSNDVDIAESCNNLASLYGDLKNLEPARKLYEEALAIFEQQLGPHHPRTLMLRTNLANQLLHEQAYDQAIELLTQVLSVSQEELGPDHTQVGHVQRNLGMAFLKQGSFDRAEQHLNQALAITTAKLGEDHLYALYIRYGLALVMGKRGDKHAAIEALKQILKITADRDPAHPLVTQTQVALEDMVAGQ